MSPSTVIFPCPFCGRRMGVPAEYLGKQVRCPNCKQVVLAPLTAAPSGAVPAVNVPPPPLTSAPPPQTVGPKQHPPTEPEYAPFVPSPRREGTDSIIGDPNESEDEVFPPSQVGRRRATVPPRDLNTPSAPDGGGRTNTDSPFEEVAGTTAALPGAGRTGAAHGATEPRNPFLESDLEPWTMPPGGIIPPTGPRPVLPAPIEAQPFPSAALPRPVPVPVSNTDPFANLEDSVSQSDPNRTSVTAELDEPPSPRRRPPRDRKAPQPEGGPRPKSKAAPAPPRAGGSNIVLYVVIGYAVLVTGLAIWGLFFRTGMPKDHPLSTIPDDFGEYGTADRKKVSQRKLTGEYHANSELPPELRAPLNGTITIGPMQVRPLKIERRPLQIVTTGARKDKEPEATRGDALVLTLEIKNLSSDLSFHPMDPAFTRKAKIGRDGAKDEPLTRLVAGGKVFAGGHIDWPFESPSRRKYEKKQEQDNKPLEPGKDREYVVFTDATNTAIVPAVTGEKGEMQWRVQVRRPPVEFGGREVPVTALIGVDFRQGDIKTPPG